MRLVIELDDATSADDLTRILGALAAERPWVRGAVLTASDGEDPRLAAALAWAAQP